MSGAIWPDVQHHVIIWSWLFKYLMSIQPTVSLIEMLKIFLSENRQFPWDATLLHDYVNACMIPVLYQQPLALEQLLFLFDYFQIVITEHMRMMLERRFNCIIRVNNAGCYHDFEILGDDEGLSTSNKARSSNNLKFTKDEDAKIVSYLYTTLNEADDIDKIRFANHPFWEEANKKMKLDRKPNSIYSRFQKLKNDSNMIMRIGIEKEKAMFLLKNIPVKLQRNGLEKTLTEIARKFSVFITADKRGWVISWRSITDTGTMKDDELFELIDSGNLGMRREQRRRTSAIGLNKDD